MVNTLWLKVSDNPTQRALSKIQNLPSHLSEQAGKRVGNFSDKVRMSQLLSLPLLVPSLMPWPLFPRNSTLQVSVWLPFVFMGPSGVERTFLMAFLEQC